MENNNTNKESKNWIKAYIVDVLPCISVACFVLAYIYNSKFYSVFGIDILQYSTFSDIFVSIVEPLCIFVFTSSLLMFFIYDLFTTTIPKIIEKKQKKKNEDNSSNKVNSEEIFQKTTNDKVAKGICLNTYRKRFIIFLTLLLMLTFANLSAIYSGDIQPSLLFASVALVQPFLLFLFFSYFFLNMLEGDFASMLYRIKTQNRNWLLVIAFYYVYAMIIFGITGHERGVMVRDRNLINFEITTTNNHIYDDSKYVYVGHIGSYTFLFDKNKKNNIILNNDGIVSTKIDPINEITFVSINYSIRRLKAIFN